MINVPKKNVVNTPKHTILSFKVEHRHFITEYEGSCGVQYESWLQTWNNIKKKMKLKSSRLGNSHEALQRPRGIFGTQEANLSKLPSDLNLCKDVDHQLK